MYICMYLCTYIHSYLHVRAGQATRPVLTCAAHALACLTEARQRVLGRLAARSWPPAQRAQLPIRRYALSFLSVCLSIFLSVYLLLFPRRGLERQGEQGGWWWLRNERTGSCSKGTAEPEPWRIASLLKPPPPFSMVHDGKSSLSLQIAGGTGEARRRRVWWLMGRGIACRHKHVMILSKYGLFSNAELLMSCTEYVLVARRHKHRRRSALFLPLYPSPHQPPARGPALPLKRTDRG